MKKRNRIVLIILLVVLALLAALALWQRSNLRALRLSMALSGEELDQRLEQVTQQVVRSSQEAGVTVRDLTPEEKAALRDHSLSSEELIERLTDGSAPEEIPEPGAAPQESAAPDGEAAGTEAPEAPTPSPAPDPDQQELSRLLAEIYVLRAEYTAWLEDANQAAIDAFNALPEAEQTTQKKYDIGMHYLELALEKESECDQAMADLEAQILAVLQRMGLDTSLVDEIDAAYQEEKTLQKAYYLNLH